MEKAKIIDLLKKKGHEETNAEKFAAYIIKLTLEKDRQTGKLKNEWIQSYKEEKVIELYERVAEDGLIFDGTNITLQKTGISYNYIAYKNKMLLAYPESKVDVQLVYKDDMFQVGKESGSVVYSHTITKPFENKKEDIIGGYCVIKNKRGETLTLLSKEDIEKHRKVSKMDNVWQEWYVEMCLKTLIKKGCRNHAADIFEAIERKDNENYDLENPLELDLALKQKIDACKDMVELTAVYNAHKGKVTNAAPFNLAISIKKQELTPKEQTGDVK